MRNKILFSIGICLVSGQLFSEVLVKNGDFLKSELANYPKKTKETFSLSDSQKSELKKAVPDAQETSFTFYYGKNEADEMQKACTIVSQMGKEGPMSVGICFGNDSKISTVKVLQFSEDHGKKVAEDSFLSQFKNKDAKQPLQVGKNVDAITGATYSTNAVVEAVSKSQYAFKVFL
ncbi:MAG: FMN-binding protein [Halobacteriovoraceae bacterium]|nr:FMN-binding protein [Halobacteriovoraceae bacterium]